jgi:hypothetical protein
MYSFFAACMGDTLASEVSVKPTLRPSTTLTICAPAARNPLAIASHTHHQSPHRSTRHERRRLSPWPWPVSCRRPPDRIYRPWKSAHRKCRLSRLSLQSREGSVVVGRSSRAGRFPGTFTLLAIVQFCSLADDLHSVGLPARRNSPTHALLQ